MEEILLGIAAFVVTVLHLVFLLCLPYSVLKAKGKIIAGRWMFIANGIWLVFIYTCVVYTWFFNLDSWPADVPGSALLGVYMAGPALFMFLLFPLVVIFNLINRLFCRIVKVNR